MRQINPSGFVLVLVLSLFSLNGVSADSLSGVTDPIAISLSYDDALDSQLDNAVPTLNKYGFKASFYVVPNSVSLRDRMEEWRALAAQGHELGNHTLYHGCRGSLPDREWVEPDFDLDKRTATALQKEVMLANTFLQAIDGKTQRTFTPPCFDRLVGGEDYLSLVEGLFVAIKGHERDADSVVLYAPSDVSAEQLITYVRQQPKQVRLINILFHGIGGDHLMVSKQAHDEFLAYLAEHRDTYVVDTYISIMSRMSE